MTTQLLYHALGVDGYTATRCWEKEGVFCLQMEAPSSCHRVIAVRSAVAVT